MKYNIELLNKMSNVSEDTLAYQYISYLKKGGGIHIKKKNRGSFTRWCGGNVTEECIRKGKNSSNPKIRKKATFAANARKWKHQEGGIIMPPFYIIDKVNNSTTNFVNRLFNPNRTHIQDWADKNKIATHKLSVGSDDYGYYIYPEVQEINGKLIDFTRPPYHSFAGQDSAIKNNDFVRVNSLNDGLWFTKNYKLFYPGFKK